MDTQVEKLRKDAVGLSEKRDLLNMSMDVLKNNDMLGTLNECELDVHLISAEIALISIGFRLFWQSS